MGIPGVIYPSEDAAPILRLSEGCDDSLSRRRQSGSSEWVLAASGKRAFWLDHENKHFPWVYWNPEVKDFTVYNLEPLEMAAFKFLVSLPSGLPKRNKFTCRFILDGSDAEIEKYLDGSSGGSSDWCVPAATAAAAAAASAGPSVNPAMPSVQVPPPPPPAASKAKKSSSKRERPEKVDVEVEETAKEDPDADLRQKKRRKEKRKEDDIVDRVLGDDAA
ncbi:hypothetical protein PIB30_026646 [Stylosanthes scabra]|uniref:Uncharacterized protein n=1 Tax=Stylosanthes scabra TaxID=79078 RepID=A0ABU6Y979_9FABA|nr:hypothetical protein [Stylosanthes scabra]